MEYEQDMGGLMPQILALTAPPGATDSKNQMGFSSTYSSKDGSDCGGLAAHPYFRRPGKGHNRDSCDSCGEGGDVICCDICPASFHLTCHDPPLDEDSIPVGDWICHQCRTGKIEDSGAPCSYSLLYKYTKSLLNTPEKEEPMIVYPGGREMKISETPLSALVKAAACINPKQFVLPFELPTPANFPGESKEMTRRSGNKKNHGRKKSNDIEGVNSYSSAKLCFICNKTNRTAQLISCDFCPLLFHMDCLDPPLVIPPMGRWQCPNHVEGYLDSHLLKSHSYTERVRLWQMVSRPVDQQKIKLEFLRRIHHNGPRSKFKVTKALRKRIKVPKSIIEYYKSPVNLLPVKQSEAGYKVPESCLEALDERFKSPIKETQKLTTSPEEQAQFLAAISALSGGLSYTPRKKPQDSKPETVQQDSSHSGKSETEDSIETGVKLNEVSDMKPTESPEIHEIPTDNASDKTKTEVPDLPTEDEQAKPIKTCVKDERFIQKMPEIPIRAILCPLVAEADMEEWQASGRQVEPIEMNFRNLKIGRGSHYDVDLNKFGFCNFISDLHAVISFDECSGCYELMNYSCYGTIMDEILYSLTPRDEQTRAEGSLPPPIEQAKNLIRNAKQKAFKDEPMMNSTPGKVLRRCFCNRNAKKKIRTEASWEGPGPIHHGSFIKFGCFSFVFCIVEDAAFGDWLEDTATLYEQVLEKEMSLIDKTTESQPFFEVQQET